MFLVVIIFIIYQVLAVPAEHEPSVSFHIAKDELSTEAPPRYACLAERTAHRAARRGDSLRVRMAGVVHVVLGQCYPRGCEPRDNQLFTFDSRSARTTPIVDRAKLVESEWTCYLYTNNSNEPIVCAVTTRTAPAPAPGSSHDGVTKWILASVGVGTVIVVFLATLCLVRRCKSAPRSSNMNRDSVMLYENIQNHRGHPSPHPGKWNASNFTELAEGESDTYSVPHRCHPDMLYSKPIPKSERNTTKQKENIMNRARADSNYSELVFELSSNTPPAATRNLHEHHYAEVSHGADSIHRHPVYENDKFNDHQYVNAAASPAPEDPAYCEINLSR